MSRVTAQDVANLAGVSRSAVSRCFSGAGNVSASARTKIHAAAKQLGYRPNAIARSLTGHQTDLVAVVTADNESFQTGRIVRELYLQLYDVGKRALIIPVGTTDGIDESSLRALDYQADAIVVIGGSVSRGIVDHLRAANTPLFLLGRENVDANLVSVCCDNFLGAQMIGRLLVRSGRKRPAYIGKAINTFSNQNRRGGFVREIEEARLELYAETSDATTYEGGRSAAIRLLGLSEPPDAIFAFNDTMALGALSAVNEYKLQVPEDIAVVGFDDIPMAGWPAFQLTTVRYDIKEIARIIAHSIVGRIDQQAAENGNILVTPELVVRSTAP
ncbi:MAG: LacI family DNA-binding transcriptional regulator [Rhodospirillales bacterium]|nr:LacI family DNA-binding transcriptional regulator [Rhodospirillales bacterium]